MNWFRRIKLSSYERRNSSMNHHQVFQKFHPVGVTGTGLHVFDFLGARTNVRFRSGWEKFAVRNGGAYTASYPPLNEHYFDWIALLDCVSRGAGVFRMAELGAGWAPWLVRAAFAAKQTAAITNIELLGVEADSTHYSWMLENFIDNGLPVAEHKLIHGAATARSGMVRFPRVTNPSEDYGASLRLAQGGDDFIEVKGHSLLDICAAFSGPIDFLHVDIQGSEYDLIPNSMSVLCTNVKGLMIGTHESDEKHEQLVLLLKQHGWEPIMVFPRRTEAVTEFGTVKFDDGFLYFRNAAFS